MLQQYATKVSPTKCGCRWEVLRINAICRDPVVAVMLPDLSAVDFVEFRDRRLEVVLPGTVLREFNLINHAINVAIDELGLAQ